MQTEPTIAADVEPTAIVADDLPPRITNQFGMTFCLVPVDPSRSDHDSSYPSKSFYLQQTEIQYEDHHRFRDAALASGFDGGIDWGFNSGLPSSSWQIADQYTHALSEFDSDYDYRLPNVKEWRFACKDGYDQQCPEFDKDWGPATTDGVCTNKFGIFGLNNNDAECSDQPDCYLGYKDQRRYAAAVPPDCRCDWLTEAHDESISLAMSVRLIIMIPRSTDR
ncbi:hypothetical protein [Rhodopirellula europaea]|uniref:Sulfatase-modifying factor enzyme domain-containing protein n=1 Tax=Rhodopirellula europaea 6C TaxID=1263867 RepID=M2AHC1_9BACT|nr:hypothetical protein [Rhodopirellula europaea]EMB16505.1 hypothetical protein RE6C_02870 [Rhodopirellula europaea 6C]